RHRLPDRAGVERVVITVEVPRSLFVHESASGYLHRVGNAKRRMSPEYLARLFQQRSQTRLIRFDEQMVGDARLTDLSPDLWQRFKTVRSDQDAETLLRKLGLATADEDGLVKPTVAGVLLASRHGRRWLPNAYVQAVAYRGTAIRLEPKGEPYQLDAADIEGPLDRQVIEACRFVFRNMRVMATKDQGRIDRPQYDMQAVFEALVNAVAHRDYSIYGSKIRLRLFENRMELYSPGAIANTLDVGSLRYRQSARNEAICSLLSKCVLPDQSWLANDRRHMMEKRGEGVPIILDNSERLSGREPEYRLIDDAELLLTIHAAAT
ncbi:MAG: transcriptional regulator, partial [Gammaproteobacteria bacterium]|nr:transcriptional regulator [Gammaproteobacteria bacterium]